MWFREDERRQYRRAVLRFDCLRHFFRNTLIGQAMYRSEPFERSEIVLIHKSLHIDNHLPDREDVQPGSPPYTMCPRYTNPTNLVSGIVLEGEARRIRMFYHLECIFKKEDNDRGFSRLLRKQLFVVSERARTHPRLQNLENTLVNTTEILVLGVGNVYDKVTRLMHGIRPHPNTSATHHSKLHPSFAAIRLLEDNLTASSPLVTLISSVLS
ncbi:hypothetical protein EJ08DRAFT_299764 [Tothia fuscella]|uniref:Uncharacterized protein n=1 Tax=Tothia fuscella TaxID=1048955 RepID=A0A9P4NPY5_9PEZI|nr:hypothetical protein EJ08DRAFT_299764 [Tothia fuscella]